ncbi:hypothetical protein SBOR_4668 [Sclerotinia borealis F-4128]|uniref:Cytochrome P450 alkane hydroxylase n=1 Tax=Sclerotinia borealis (strain F-4128) TaxID=1432307 RepID=W9CJV9_SCLBF|nr:hypothetical protein SBOR_4668 [Sclerotinia borealis F-4128]
MFDISLIILTGALSVLLYVVVKSRANKAKSSNHRHGYKHPATYPHLDPFFGLDLKLQEIRQSLRNQGIPFMSNLHKKYGKTIEVNNLGALDLRTVDSENLQTAWSINNSDWGYQPYRLPVMGPFCGRGFITTDNESWQKARVLLRPTFSKANISDLKPFITSAEEFFKGIPEDGHTTVDLQPALASLFVGTSMKFILGIAPRSGTDGRPSEVTAFLKAFQKSFLGMGLSFMLGPIQFLIPKSMKSEAYKQVQEYLDSLIETEINNAQNASKIQSNELNQKSLLQGLVKETDDRIKIRDNALQGMMAVQDTTPVLLSNTLFLLSRNPKIYDRLRDEVQSLDLESSLHLYDKLRDLSFLHNIIHESLRLYPIFPTLARISLTDTTLPRGGGKDGESPIYVPKDTKLYANFYGLHRVESVFGHDIESFNPDRWYSIKPSPWEYMPFGGGPRACVGQHKALAEASYTLAKFAQQYKKIESRDARDWAGQRKLSYPTVEEQHSLAPYQTKNIQTKPHNTKQTSPPTMPRTSQPVFFFFLATITILLILSIQVQAQTTTGRPFPSMHANGTFNNTSTRHNPSKTSVGTTSFTITDSGGFATGTSFNRAGESKMTPRLAVGGGGKRQRNVEDRRVVGMELKLGLELEDQE